MNIPPIAPNTIQSNNTLHKTTGKENTKQDLKSLRDSCREFEAIFIDQMYKSMRKSMPENGLIPQDNASKIYQDMLDMQMARETAKGKGIGIGEAMYNQLKLFVHER
jgi:flagellar protein FlgJ